MSNINLKYTQEQEHELKADYAAIAVDDHDTREKFILVYMHKHKKSKRSVIAKLSKMSNSNGEPLYIARPKVSKVTNEKPQTKDQMVGNLTTMLGFSTGELEGLDKTPKLVLDKLVKRLFEDQESRKRLLDELNELRLLTPKGPSIPR